MKTSLMAIIAVLSLTGCDERSQVQVEADNQTSLSTPIAVGVLSDGRILYYSRVQHRPGSTPHHIYFAGNDVSINYSYKSGKTTINEHQSYIGEPAKVPDVVILNGQRLDPNEVQQALTRDEDARRIKERK